MTRYFAETPCEHGRVVFHRSPVGVKPEWECYQGSRVELHPTQPDYDGAYETLLAKIPGWLFNEYAVAAVDSAVEGLVLLAEDRL